MPDEFYEQYNSHSHLDLYTMVMGGSPGQIEGLVATWKSIETTMSGLAASLRADLDRLLATWDSAAGREFDRRVGLVASFAEMLATEFAAIHTGLTAMSSALAEAQSRAEPPDVGQDQGHGNAATGMLAGSILGPVGTLIGGVIGGHLGRERDEAEQERARQRIVRLVCALAADYRITDFGTWPPQVPAPQPDTPGYRPGAVMGEAAPVAQATHQGSQQLGDAPSVTVVAPGPATNPSQPTAPTNPPTVTPAPTDSTAVPAVAAPNYGDTAGENQYWGTAPVIAGAIAAAVAGGIAAASAVANRDQDAGDGEAEDAEVGADGVVRATMGSAPIPVEPSIVPIDVAAAGSPAVEPGLSGLPALDLSTVPGATPVQSMPGVVPESPLPTLDAGTVSEAATATVTEASSLAGGAGGGTPAVDAAIGEADARGGPGNQPPPPPAAGTGMGTATGTTTGMGSVPGGTVGGGGTSLASAGGSVPAAPAHTAASGHGADSGARGIDAGARGPDAGARGVDHGARALDDRSWVSDGTATWGDETSDPVSLTRSEGVDQADWDEDARHA